MEHEDARDGNRQGETGSEAVKLPIGVVRDEQRQLQAAVQHAALPFGARQLPAVTVFGQMQVSTQMIEPQPAEHFRVVG